MRTGVSPMRIVTRSFYSFCCFFAMLLTPLTSYASHISARPFALWLFLSSHIPSSKLDVCALPKYAALLLGNNLSLGQINNNTTLTFSILRKEVIQPHLPIRLPCYDFTPVIRPAFDCSLHKWLGHRLRAFPTPMV